MLCVLAGTDCSHVSGADVIAATLPGAAPRFCGAARRPLGNTSGRRWRRFPRALDGVGPTRRPTFRACATGSRGRRSGGARRRRSPHDLHGQPLRRSVHLYLGPLCGGSARGTRPGRRPNQPAASAEHTPRPRGIVGTCRRERRRRARPLGPLRPRLGRIRGDTTLRRLRQSRRVSRSRVDARGRANPTPRRTAARPSSLAFNRAGRPPPRRDRYHSARRGGPAGLALARRAGGTRRLARRIWIVSGHALPSRVGAGHFHWCTLARASGRHAVGAAKSARCPALGVGLVRADSDKQRQR